MDISAIQSKWRAKMPTARRSAIGELPLREAVFRICCNAPPDEAAKLVALSPNNWRHLLHWLDTSGLALYFFDRLLEMDLIEAMAAESLAIQQRMQQSGASYAVLKGFSLSPVSVPNPHLRSQLDHDFLIAESDAEKARRILEDFGYRLMIKSGSSWEFKSESGGVGSLQSLYKSGMSRQAELHLESNASGQDSRLKRARTAAFRGIPMPVLSPADLFIGQGLHVFKHVCSAFSRAAHLVEFHRHVVARYNDTAFWEELRAKCDVRPEIGLRLGVVILLASRLLGPFAPFDLIEWTVGRLSSEVILWIDTYGAEIVLVSFPGSKLYLLLEQELATAGVATKRPVAESLVPRRLPPPILAAVAEETRLQTLERRYRQIHYLLFRLRFHALEGIRYGVESKRWQRIKDRLTP
jgi:hypothetical protein